MGAETDLTIGTLNGGTTAEISYAALTDAKGVATAINGASSGVGVTATATNSATFGGVSIAGTVSFNLIGGTALTGGSAISAVIAVPLGVMTAVYITEVRGRAVPYVRFFVQAMSGVPSDH